MVIDYPLYIAFFLGLFVGLFIGNDKFRRECSALLARFMGSKKKKNSTQPHQDN